MCYIYVLFTCIVSNYIYMQILYYIYINIYIYRYPCIYVYISIYIYIYIYIYTKESFFCCSSHLSNIEKTTILNLKRGNKKQN